jgi:hypothetical protein
LLPFYAYECCVPFKVSFGKLGLTGGLASQSFLSPPSASAL